MPWFRKPGYEARCLDTGRRWLARLALSGLLLPAPGCGGPGPPTDELLVFAAASLSDVLPEIGEAFGRESGVEAVFNFAGSNLLAQQILASPRGDLFVSANETWMQRLETAGRLAPGSRRMILSNSLAVIAHAGSRWEIRQPSDLCGADFRFLALGDPAAVPAGRYAREWMESLACGDRTLWDAVADRVSPAPDVRAALGQVEGAKDLIGVVYHTDFRAARSRVRLLFQVPPGEGPSIRYEASLLKDARNPAAAGDFMNFLSSRRARHLFQEAGFLVPDRPGITLN